MSSPPIASVTSPSHDGKREGSALAYLSSRSLFPHSSIERQGNPPERPAVFQIGAAFHGHKRSIPYVPCVSVNHLHTSELPVLARQS